MRNSSQFLSALSGFLVLASAWMAAPAAGQAGGGATFSVESQPAGMAAVMAKNRLWLAVAFPDEHIVRILSDQGEVVGEDESVLEPLGIAVGTKVAYVSSGKTGEVHVFQRKGTRVIGTDRSLGVGPGEFQRPVAIAIHPVTEAIYVADVVGGDVKYYDKDTLQQLGTIGATQLTAPCGLAFNSKNELFVSDMMEGEVSWFYADGTYFRQMTRSGDDPGETVRPIGLGVDAQDQVYVVDAFFGHVQLYAATGAWVKSIGSIGRGPGLVQTPLDLVVHPTLLTVYVSDSTDQEVERYDSAAGQ